MSTQCFHESTYSFMVSVGIHTGNTIHEHSLSGNVSWTYRYLVGQADSENSYMDTPIRTPC